MLHWDLISRNRSSDLTCPASGDEFIQQIDMDGRQIRFEWSSWETGKSLGMKCLTVDTGAMRTVLLPIPR